MTTTPSTASQAPEVLTRQVAAWRAEVARLNDLIAHATGASQAPAVSIDTPEFRRMLTEFATTWYDHPGEESKRREIFKYIDAKLAQERNRADSMEAARDDAVNAEYTAIARATAAEAKLEAIRQGVEKNKIETPEFRRMVVGAGLQYQRACIEGDPAGHLIAHIQALIAEARSAASKADEGGLPG